MRKLNLNALKRNKQILKVGTLTQQVIDLLDLVEKPKDIKIWYDRLEHCEKHIKDFKSLQSYIRSMESIPEIINNPDYVGLHPKNDSIQYIKKLMILLLLRLE